MQRVQTAMPEVSNCHNYTGEELQCGATNTAGWKVGSFSSFLAYSCASQFGDTQVAGAWYA